MDVYEEHRCLHSLESGKRLELLHLKLTHPHPHNLGNCDFFPFIISMPGMPSIQLVKRRIPFQLSRG